jgi:hypothetical protein
VKTYSQLTLFTRVEQPAESPTPAATPTPDGGESAPAEGVQPAQPTPAPAPADPGEATVIVQGSREVDSFEEIKRIDSRATAWTRWEQPIDYTSLRLIVEGPRRSNSVTAQRVRVLLYLTPRPAP